MKTRSWLVAAVVGVCLVAVAVLSIADPPDLHRDAEEAASVLAVRRVRTAEVSAEPAARSLSFPGVLRAADRVSLSFPVGDRLAARPVRLGDRVDAGEVVARLESEAMRHQLEEVGGTLREAETRLEQARRDRRRLDELYAVKAATENELEDAEAAVAGLEAVVAGARARSSETDRRLTETVLRAPFAGVVTAVAAEPGERVAPGQPVLELSGEGALEVETQLPESIAGVLAEGAAVEVRLPFSGAGEPAIVPGRLVRVGLAAATAGGLFPVRVEIAETVGLLPGMAAEVRFPLPAREQFTVPLAAVLDPGASRPHVFKVVGGVVVRTPVEVVALEGDRIGVRGELAAGDRVVTTGHTSLVDGDPVEVVP